MHGEYKVPNGKLVVADLSVEDGKLRRVEISGDFFLEPDHTIDRIAAALEGAPGDADEAELAGRVQAATAGATLVGITPEGVAVAVRRAIDGGAQ